MEVRVMIHTDLDLSQLVSTAKYRVFYAHSAVKVAVCEGDFCCFEEGDVHE